MQEANSSSKLHGIDRPKRTAALIHYDFEDARSTKTLERFGIDMLSPILCLIECEAYSPPHIRWATGEVLSARTDKQQRLRLSACIHCMPFLASRRASVNAFFCGLMI